VVGLRMGRSDQRTGIFLMDLYITLIPNASKSSRAQDVLARIVHDKSVGSGK